MVATSILYVAMGSQLQCFFYELPISQPAKELQELLPVVALGAETRRRDCVQGGARVVPTEIGEQSISAISPCRSLARKEVYDVAATVNNGQQKEREADALCGDTSSGLAVVGRCGSFAASSCGFLPTSPMRAQMAFSKPDHPLFSPPPMEPQFKSQRTPCLGLPVCVPLRSRQVLSKSYQSIAFPSVGNFMLIEYCRLPPHHGCACPFFSPNFFYTGQYPPVSCPPKLNSHMLHSPPPTVYSIQYCIQHQQNSIAGSFAPT